MRERGAHEEGGGGGGVAGKLFALSSPCSPGPMDPMDPTDPSRRPVVYITYARPGFRDDANFSARRYRRLPAAAYEEGPREFR